MSRLLTCYLLPNEMDLATTQHLADEGQHGADETEVGVTEGAASPSGVQTSQSGIGEASQEGEEQTIEETTQHGTLPTTGRIAINAGSATHEEVNDHGGQDDCAELAAPAIWMNMATKPPTMEVR